MVVKDTAPLKAIYFINRGFANTLLNLGSTDMAYGRQEKVTGVLGPLEHFGLESFVKRGKVKVSMIAVRTVTYCDMMGLAITDLTAIIAANNLEWAQEKAAQAAKAKERMNKKVNQLGLTSNFIRRLKAKTPAQPESAEVAEGEGSQHAGAPSRIVAALRGSRNTGKGANTLAGVAKASIAGKRCQFAIASTQQEVAMRRTVESIENGESVDGFVGTVAAMVAQARLNSISAVEAEEPTHKHKHLLPQMSIRGHHHHQNAGSAVSGGEKTRGSGRSKTRARDEQARLKHRQQTRASAHAACGGGGAFLNGVGRGGARSATPGLVRV